MNTSRHRFYINTEFSHGDNNQVKKGTLSCSLGTQDGELSWNTKRESAGKYFCICSPHASLGMGGAIVI